MVLKLFTTFIVVAAILASPKHRDFTWSYRSSIYRVHWLQYDACTLVTFCLATPHVRTLFAHTILLLLHHSSNCATLLRRHLSASFVLCMGSYGVITIPIHWKKKKSPMPLEQISWKMLRGKTVIRLKCSWHQPSEIYTNSQISSSVCKTSFNLSNWHDVILLDLKFLRRYKFHTVKYNLIRTKKSYRR